MLTGKTIVFTLNASVFLSSRYQIDNESKNVTNVSILRRSSYRVSKLAEFITLKFQCFILGNLKEISGFKSYKESKRGEGKGIEIFVAREYGRFQNSFLCYTRN